ncbi:MAG: hypothetical protein ACYTEW_26310, partial [Planctomycetota bacterium]
MKRIRDVDLMLFYPIAKLADEVYAELTTEVLAQDIAVKMAEDANGLYQLYSGERIVKFRAGGCSLPEERKVELSGDVVVMESDVDSKQLLRTLRCKKALLHVEGEASTLTLTMEVYSPMWRQPDGTEGFARRPIIR